MASRVRLEDIYIRTELQPGDIGYVIFLHGDLYKKEYGYGISFETYVAKGLHDFVSGYNPLRDAVWICEHDHKIIGFLLLMDRGNSSAQLRYFLLKPGYRGIGLGKKLIGEFMACVKARGYTHVYLWTTHEQLAAASLYIKYGFKLSEEKESTAFGKLLTEQRYDLFLKDTV